MFHDEDTNDINCTDVMEHQTLLGNTAPVRRPQYRTQYAPRHEMEDQVVNMLDKGIIRASNFSWLAARFLVPKKTADGEQKYRFCVDFKPLTRRRNLNHIQCQGRGTFHLSTVIVDSGRFPLKRNIKSALDLRFNRDIMNLTG